MPDSEKIDFHAIHSLESYGVYYFLWKLDRINPSNMKC
jgi:hypothetical protein